MPSSTRTPPRAQASLSGWPTRRMPRWAWLVAAGLLVIAVAVAIVHRPSRSERASDLHGLLTEVTADIQSCAGGVGESLTALHDVQAEHFGNAKDISDGISLAQQGSANCSPATNELLDDLENYQVPESLDSFRLTAAVSDMITWAAPDAQQVQTDVADLLAARTSLAKSQAAAALGKAVSKLDAERTAIDNVMNKAIKSLALHASPPPLPG